MRFSNIHLENWRNFTRVEADLGERVFVVGPNASGKSNLLDVLRFLRDIAVPGGGFRTAVAQRGGVSRLRCLAARRYPDIVIDVEIRNGDDGSDAAWRYRLAFGQDNNRQPILKEEAVWHEGRQVLARPDADDVTDPARLAQTHLEQVNANKDFRVVADFFGSVRYLHIVPQVVREPERSGGRRDDPHGGDFIERLAQVQEKTRNARLRRIAEALHVAVPQLKELRQIRDERGVPHLEGLFEHWRPDAGW